ncbi:DUF3102 domain-containing protein [Mesorhizobium sp. B2-7-1]|uniref:DUF3102 domain-containing protein n=1 Tax=Mesorhizobium sp. B2-7-1 TaxID=2589909 RepID=UPI0011294A82|nr:DUF3102 domain-containing protein [Mesorhizobium sp. B2-7-1]TPJ46839.1 DUF3102 domain-containing protein [Mesorhizobium sp. B2-7-1]
MQPPEKREPVADQATGSSGDYSSSSVHENNGNLTDFQQKLNTIELLSNSLADLAEQVRQAASESDTAERTSVSRALDAGQMLVEAKASCEHGQWLPFLDRAGIHERRARRLMQIARSGLNSDIVSDLGGIGAALAFTSKWQLPSFDQALFIYDPEDGETPVGRGVGYVWEDHQHRGFYHAGMIVTDHDGEEECIASRRPMLPFVDVEGDRPINIIVHFLTRRFTLPIADWRFGSVDRQIPIIVLAPFINGNTFREGAAA